MVKIHTKRLGSIKMLCLRLMLLRVLNSYMAKNFLTITLRMLMQPFALLANLKNRQWSHWSTWILAVLVVVKIYLQRGQGLMKLIRFLFLAVLSFWTVKLIWRQQKKCMNYSWKLLLHQPLTMMPTIFWQRRKIFACWPLISPKRMNQPVLKQFPSWVACWCKNKIL